jgi:UDP-glucose 4-epimerase
VTIAWVVGQGGMLGGAVAHAIDADPRRRWRLIQQPGLPWGDDGAFAAAVDAGLEALRDAVSAAAGEDWAIVWVAGAAVTAATAEQVARELAQFRLFCERVAAVFDAELLARGCLFYSSSAGGVYGGSTNPPFTEETEPAPISLYGRFKLDAEQLAVRLTASGCRVLVGRITNLYGPGQKLGKLQGLISHLAKAQLSPKPATIFVPVETVRDYIFVDDCARLLLDALDRLLGCPAGTGVTKILGSGRGTSIADLLGQFRQIEKRRPNAMLGYSAQAALQGLDLRMRSVVWPELDHRELTPLAAGIGATMDDVLLQVQHPEGVR